MEASSSTPASPIPEPIRPMDISGATRTFYIVLGVLTLIGGGLTAAGAAFGLFIMFAFGAMGTAAVLSAIGAVIVIFGPALALALGFFKFKKRTPILYNVLFGITFIMSVSGLVIMIREEMEIQQMVITVIQLLIGGMIAVRIHRDRALFIN